MRRELGSMVMAMGTVLVASAVFALGLMMTAWDSFGPFEIVGVGATAICGAAMLFLTARYSGLFAQRRAHD
jgi:hypothetical protein